MPRLLMSLTGMVLAGLLADGVQAQTVGTPAAPHSAAADPFRLITDAQLAGLATGTGALTLSTLTDHENFYVLEAGRTGPGEVEVHEHWNDYMAIQQGEAEFTSGGVVTGARDTGPGEKRGGVLTGGTKVTLRPGDFVMVPAGEPHLTMIKPGSVFRALVFKVRQ